MQAIANLTAPTTTTTNKPHLPSIKFLLESSVEMFNGGKWKTFFILFSFFLSFFFWLVFRMCDNMEMIWRFFSLKELVVFGFSLFGQQNFFNSDGKKLVNKNLKDLLTCEHRWRSTRFSRCSLLVCTKCKKEKSRKKKNFFNRQFFMEEDL